VGRTPAPAALPPLDGGYLIVMNSLVYQVLREVLSKRAFAREEESPWPCVIIQRGGLQGHVQLRPPAVDACPLMPAAEVERWVQQMWEQRKELSDLDVDVLDGLSAIWLHQSRSLHEELLVSVDQLLRLRSLQPKRSGQGRRGGYEPEQRAAMLRVLAHIQNLYVSMAMLPGDGDDRKGRHQRTRLPQGVQGRTFLIADAEEQPPPNSAHSGPYVLFRLGEVLTPWLGGPRHQTAWLSVRALQYDPYRKTWAKRMARYLSWQWRIQAAGGDYLRPYRVATLLEAVGERIDLSNPGRTKARLERALDLLQADHVIAAWQYTQREGMKHSGWAKGWRQVTVRIDPPDAIREAYQHLKRSVARQPSVRLGANILGEQLKHRRRLLGLSQRRAAEQMGISQAFVNLIEQGQRGKRLSTSVQRQIMAWLTGDG
jgi:hypothetical protein